MYFNNQRLILNSIWDFLISVADPQENLQKEVFGGEQHFSGKNYPKTKQKFIIIMNEYR